MLYQRIQPPTQRSLKQENRNPAIQNPLKTNIQRYKTVSPQLLIFVKVFWFIQMAIPREKAAGNHKTEN